MSSKETRSTQNSELVELSNIYFNKLGLSNSVKYFFRTDAIRAILQTTYKQYEETVKTFVEQLPADRKAEGEHRLEGLTEEREKYNSFVIDAFKIRMAQAFVACEEFVPVDEALAKIFIRAFADEADGKLQDNVIRISKEVAGRMYAEMCKGLLPESTTTIACPVGLQRRFRDKQKTASNTKPNFWSPKD